MAKHDVDPVLRQLVRAVNESGQAAVPVTVSLHGTTLTGTLIAQNMYFSDLVEANPLMSALEPTSGLLGKEYGKEAEAESDHYLHLRAIDNQCVDRGAKLAQRQLRANGSTHTTRAHDRQWLARKRRVVHWARRPVDRVLQHTGDRAVIFRRGDQ